MAEGQIASMGRPYGDIFFIDTPYTDAAVQRLQQESRMRAAQQQQENQLLDAQFQKDLGKVRSVDQPDIIAGYQKYKDLKKKLLFDKGIRKDPYAYNQLQQETNLAMADLMKTSTQSAELKKQAQTLFENRVKQPDNYVDEFGGLMTQMQQTPIKSGGRVNVNGQEIDLFNPDTYVYRGGNFDFGKAVKEAGGTPRVIGSIEEPIGKENLQTKVTPYSYGNSPAQVRDYLLGNFAQRGAGRAAAYQWNNLPQGEYERVQNAYSQIPADKLKRMGLSATQDLGQITPDNPARNYANYLAMRYAVDTEPTLGTPQFRNNQENLLNKQQAQRKELEALRKGNQEALVRLRAKLKAASQEEQNNWLEAFKDNLIENAKTKGAIKYQRKDGTVVDTYEMDVSPQMKKAFGEIDALRVLPDGNIMYITYERYGKGDKREGEVKSVNGRRPVDPEFSGTLSPQEFKARIGKDMLGVKALNESLDVEDFDEGDEDEGFAPIGPASKSVPQKQYSVGDKKYSMKQLKELGYSDEEIKQAIKAGIIK